MTIRQMAEALGITRNAYYMKETGRRNFSAKEVIEICKMSNVRAEDLELD